MIDRKYARLKLLSVMSAQASDGSSVRSAEPKPKATTSRRGIADIAPRGEALARTAAAPPPLPARSTACDGVAIHPAHGAASTATADAAAPTRLAIGLCGRGSLILQEKAGRREGTP